MFNHPNRILAIVIIALALIILGCTLPTPGAPTATNPSPVATSPSTEVESFAAKMSEVTGKVDAKQTSSADYAPAENGLTLQVGGEALTGDDGRARLDFSDGTILRVGPSSHFILNSMQSNQNGTDTKISLDAGSLWILLSTGSLEVETPSGLASVRGSYLHVEILEDNKVRITCLEGDCTLGNGAGTVNLVAGQAAVVVNANEAPQMENMTEEDFNQWLEINPEATVIIPDVTATQESLVTPSPTPQPSSTPVSVGPNQEDFPTGYNPLTGQQAMDPSTLNSPAMVLSISNFPVVTRPQGGLSFAAFVYEFTITMGENRFLGVFYGDFPKAELPPVGECEMRKDPFVKTATVLGNRVWHDANKNGIQDVGEKGIGGVCVNLYDASGKMIEQTGTDTNGFYGFNVEPGVYTIEFVKPDKWDFTTQGVGDEDHDSDADQKSGRVEAITVDSDSLSWDAGFFPTSDDVIQFDPKDLPKAEVGPIRSGRIFYKYIADFYPSSCLVYAFASGEVQEKIPQCAMVAHEDAGGGSMMPLERMGAVAEDNRRKTKSFNYSGNLFSDIPPEGGVPANRIDIFWAYLNQAAWVYDPLYGAYWRYTDTADKNAPGVLHPDIDRLTGRQLSFENFIVLLADHEAIKPTIIDIKIDIGEQGDALLFRDGQMFKIRWSTRADDYTQKTGQRRPMQFTDASGNPVALKPGHTWVMMVTPFSLIEEKSPGMLRVRYYRPEGEASGSE